MTDMALDRIAWLEGRLHHLEAVVNRTQTALESAARLGDFQINVTKQDAPEKILAAADRKIREVVDFKRTAFFLIDEEDSDLHLHFCNPKQTSREAQTDLDYIVEHGGVPLEKSVPAFLGTDPMNGNKLMVQSLATDSRVRGLFIGLPAVPFHDVHDSALCLVSLVLLNCANTIESLRLYEFNRKTLAQLKHSENRFSNIVEHLPYPLAVFDRIGAVQYLNKAFQEIFGCDKAAFKGLGGLLADLAPAPINASELERLLKAEWDNPKNTPIREINFRSRARGRLTTMLSQVIIDENESVLAITDITAQRAMEATLRTSEKYYRELFENTGTAMVLFGNDMVIVDCNSEFEQMVGESAEDIIGNKTWTCFVHPADGEELTKAHRSRTQAKDKTNRQLELRLRTRTGEVRIVFCRLSVVPSSEYRIVSLIDITDRTKMERELRDSEDRYRLLAKSAHDVTWAIDGNKNVTYVSPSCEPTLGCSEKAFKIMLLVNLFEIKSQQILNHAVERGLASEDDFNERLELEFIRDDGEKMWFDTLLTNVRSEADSYRLMGVIRDISKRKQYESRLRHLALHDQLTGLPNRMLFTDRLGQAIARIQRRPDYIYAVMMIDLDRFKEVNDSHGHHVGDILLREVGERIKQCLRKVDTVARFGGDEFAVLMEEFDSCGLAMEVAKRIKRIVSDPYLIEESWVRISCSVGLVLRTKEYQNSEEVLRDADISLYRSKDKGRDKIRVFRRSLREEHMQQLCMEKDLRQAMENDEFRLYYQPVYRLCDDQLLGFEALIRWQHPERGIIPPCEFIPFAEKSGMIERIGEKVLDLSCRKLQEFRDNSDTSDLFISVNVSGKQMSYRLIQLLENALKSYGFPPQLLRLELTETVLMENADQALDIFEKVNQLGVKIAIDDFGTGYSSLSYLQNFPVDVLKIDKAFISGISNEKSDTRMVQAITAMASSLGYDLIVEGVEQETQRDILRGMGCYAGQGYLYSKPVAESGLERFFGRCSGLSTPRRSEA